MLRRARYCHGNSSVRRLSVSGVQVSWSRRLEYYEIYFLANYRRLLFSLQSADPNNTDLLQREHPEILTGVGVGQITHGIVWLLMVSHSHLLLYSQLTVKVK